MERLSIDIRPAGRSTGRGLKTNPQKGSRGLQMYVFDGINLSVTGFPGFRVADFLLFYVKKRRGTL